MEKELKPRTSLSKIEELQESDNINTLSKTKTQKDITATLSWKMESLIYRLRQTVKHFPRDEKFGLSLEIKKTAYKLDSLIIEANKKYHKKTTLTQLDIVHEQLRRQLHLAKELGMFEYYLNKKTTSIIQADKADLRFVYLNEAIDEIGKMIGGWIKSTPQ